MEAKREQSHSWWFDSHNNPTHSPWLVSTLAELDEKIKVMLKLMEGDADNFVQCVDMYYKRRPELMNMIEDLYRSHRSLIERYDQLRTRNLSDQTSLSSDESEVVDPEEEFESEDKVKESSDTEHGEHNTLTLMKEEIEALKEENKNLRGELETFKEVNKKLGGELEAMGGERREAIMDFSWIRSNFLGFSCFKRLEGTIWMKYIGGHF